jgi:hypothetical protein
LVTPTPATSIAHPPELRSSTGPHAEVVLDNETESAALRHSTEALPDREERDFSFLFTHPLYDRLVTALVATVLMLAERLPAGALQGVKLLTALLFLILRSLLAITLIPLLNNLSS